MFSSAKTWVVGDETKFPEIKLIILQTRKSGLDYVRVSKPFDDSESEHEHETTTTPAWSKNQTKRQSTQSTKSTQSSLENYRGFLTERSNSLYDTPEQHNYFYDTVGYVPI